MATTDKQSKISKINSNWATCINPLRGLTKPQIEQMLQNARQGNDVRLQIAFKEIERTMPIFGICIEKRLAGIINRKWAITRIDESDEAYEQVKAVQKVFDKCDSKNQDGLTNALRHLGLATFRGRSCVKPFFHGNDLVLKCLDNWNVLDINNHLYWNPNGNSEVDFENPKLAELSNSEVCVVRNELPIDIPGIQIYLRQLVGEEQWARAVEKYGVAQVLITAPEGTTESQLALWENRAFRIFEGGSGVLPSGSQVEAMTDARGQDPFSEYIRHQMEMISILAIGGSLNTIGGSTGLGSDLASQQNEQFQSLINQDCKKISNAISETIVIKVVKHLFGNVDCKVRFTFIEDQEYSANEYIDMAIKLNQLGMKVDVKKLKELTKLNFIQDVEEWSPNTNNTNDNDQEWTPNPSD